VDGQHAYYVTALSVGAIVCIAASNGGSTSQDLKTGYILGATPKYLQVAILFGSFASALVLGPMLLALNNSQERVRPRSSAVAPAGLHVDVATLTRHREAARGPRRPDDPKTYHVWHKSDPAGAPPRNTWWTTSGNAVWLVDPGINGTTTTAPTGRRLRSSTPRRRC
jgi:hypothetical protein